MKIQTLQSEVNLFSISVRTYIFFISSSNTLYYQFSSIVLLSVYFSRCCNLAKGCSSELTKNIYVCIVFEMTEIEYNFIENYFEYQFYYFFFLFCTFRDRLFHFNKFLVALILISNKLRFIFHIRYRIHVYYSANLQFKEENEPDRIYRRLQPYCLKNFPCKVMQINNISLVS